MSYDSDFSTPQDGSIPPPNQFSSQHPLGPQKRGRSVIWWVLGAIALGFGGIVAGCAGIAMLYSFSEKEEPLTARDRAMLVTAADVDALVEGGLRLSSSAETTSKLRSSLDDAVTLEYEYDEGEEGEFYMSSTVSVDPSESDARLTYSAFGIGADIGFSLSGEDEIEEKERNDVFKWGDQSRFVIYFYDGAPVGNLFITRKGKRVFFLLLWGVFFDEHDAFDDLVGEKLRKLSSYNP